MVPGICYATLCMINNDTCEDTLQLCYKVCKDMIEANKTVNARQVDTMWVYQNNGTSGHVPDNPPIDYTVFWDFLEMVGGDDPEVADEFVTLFIDDARMYLVTMRYAIDTGDVKMITQAAHTLKSNSAQFGALNLSFYCREIETIGHSTLKLIDLLNQAEAEYNRVKQILTTIRNCNYRQGRM